MNRTCCFKEKKRHRERKMTMETLMKLACLVLALLMLCGVAVAEDKDTLVWAMSADPASLDPMNTASMNTFTITYALYDCLTISDGNGGYKPYLADDVVMSDDGLTYTVTFTKDVSFHDGSKMTVEDIKYSLDRTIAAGWAFDMTSCIEEVVVVDDHTVEIRLNTPFGGMMGSLASPFFAIMSKEYCESKGNDAMKREPMGSGAYKLVEWVSGDHILLEANEDYFAGAPAIKNIYCKPITDKNTGLIALENGEINTFMNVNTSDIPAVEADDNLSFYACDSASVLSLNMNVEDPILSNELVRKAICSAINKNDIILGALDGMGTAANSPIPTVCAGYSAETPSYTYDVQQAKDLLAQAGYPNGLTLKLCIKEDSTYQKVATIIQAELKMIGIDVEIELMEGGAYTNAVYSNGDYQMTVGSWSAMFLDAYSVMYSQFHKDCYGGTGNITHVTTDELSDLLDAAAKVNDDEKVAAYDAVCANIVEHAYQMPLVYQQTTITATKDVQGLDASPLGCYMLKDLSFGE